MARFACWFGNESVCPGRFESMLQAIKGRFGRRFNEVFPRICDRAADRCSAVAFAFLEKTFDVNLREFRFLKSRATGCSIGELHVIDRKEQRASGGPIDDID